MTKATKVCFSYFVPMFVRKEVNRSGSMSIVVVSKPHGKFTEVKKCGVINSEEEANKLLQKAQLFCNTSVSGRLQFRLNKKWKAEYKTPFS